jgi:hypothetical protein
MCRISKTTDALVALIGVAFVTELSQHNQCDGDLAAVVNSAPTKAVVNDEQLECTFDFGAERTELRRRRLLVDDHWGTTIPVADC